MSHAFLSSSLTVVVALLSLGCGAEGGAEPLVVEETHAAVEGPRALDGRLEGTVGPASGIDADATELSLYDGYYITVETVVVSPERAVMTLLSASNASSLFTAGTSASFAFDSIDAMQVTVLGGGDEPGVYNLLGQRRRRHGAE